MTGAQCRTVWLHRVSQGQERGPCWSKGSSQKMDENLGVTLISFDFRTCDQVENIITELPGSVLAQEVYTGNRNMKRL